MKKVIFISCFIMGLFFSNNAFAQSLEELPEMGDGGSGGDGPIILLGKAVYNTNTGLLYCDGNPKLICAKIVKNTERSMSNSTEIHISLDGKNNFIPFPIRDNYQISNGVRKTEIRFNFAD
jgi:hypothetical protein